MPGLLAILIKTVYSKKLYLCHASFKIEYLYI